MPSCMHCGAHCADPAAASCPRCGRPLGGGVPAGTRQPTWAPGPTGTPGTNGTTGKPGATGTTGTSGTSGTIRITGTTGPPGTTGSGYVRVGSTILPQWLLWLMAVLLVAGGVTAVVLLNSSPDPSYPTVGVVPSTAPTPPPTLPQTPDIGTWPPPDDSTPSPPDTSPTPDSASATVQEYYRDINNRDFSAAWELGGKNIGGSSYSEWVAGYGTTEHVELSAVDTEGGGQVSAVLRATQNDGSEKVYEGTYTVSGGEIVSADITPR